jgi:hypothetical protein
MIKMTQKNIKINVRKQSEGAIKENSKAKGE